MNASALIIDEFCQVLLCPFPHLAEPLKSGRERAAQGECGKSGEVGEQVIGRGYNRIS